MLKLRRGVVVEADPLVVEVDGERRRAWADEAMVGPAAVGDEVVVNVAALDLGLGSGGFDVVHVNLTRGLEGGETPPGVHVMKLNYSPLQIAVDPVDAGLDSPPLPERRIPVLVLPLHGHLSPAAWAAAAATAGHGTPGEARLGGATPPGAGGSSAPDRDPDAASGVDVNRRIGFVQAGGGGLPGSLSRDVRELRARGLLDELITASPSYGGPLEAITPIGALHAACERGWDAAIIGPGPGILGSGTRYGHGGMAALEAAHAALALGLPTLLSPRMSSGDPRPRHLGLSHHTRAVLELLLAPVGVPVPEDLTALWPADADASPDDALELAVAGRHRPARHPVALQAYAGSGLPRRTMGRDLDDDPLFFAAPLAAGAALGEAIAARL